MRVISEVDPVFAERVIREVRRVFCSGTHVKNVVLAFGVDGDWTESARDALAALVTKEVNTSQYYRQVSVFIPFPDPAGQWRLLIHVFNDSNASGQEHAPK